jgi:CheY-like chemotaxis protein
MLIDDNELDNFLNQKIIEANHFASKVYMNTGGRCALEFLKNIAVNAEVADKILPDVIFVDINMPLMDGFQFIEQFERFSVSLNKKTKIAILTTSLNPEDKERALALKSEVLFLHKPLTEKMLAEI